VIQPPLPYGRHPSRCSQHNRQGAVVFLLLAFSLHAQNISGGIAGTVLDPSGAVVPRAIVTITNTDRNAVVRTITTGVDGNYSAPLLDVGTYSIAVSAAGFRNEIKTGIKLNVHDELSINISLRVGDAADQVTVVADTEAVELGSASNDSTMEASEIRELSISTRNYEQLVALMPGVSTDNIDQIYIGNSLPSGLANAMPYSINGQRNSANNWTVDRADNVDRGSNLTLLNYPSVDSIEQFKVSRSLYSADTGRAGGAHISVVTRSATRDYHGTAYEFIRNDAFAANNWINNANRVNVVDGKAKVRRCAGTTSASRSVVPFHGCSAAPVRTERSSTTRWSSAASSPTPRFNPPFPLWRSARAISECKSARRSPGAPARRAAHKSQTSTPSPLPTSRTSSASCPRPPVATPSSFPRATYSTIARNK